MLGCSAPVLLGSGRRLVAACHLRTSAHLYRRVLRACSRLLRRSYGKAAEEQQHWIVFEVTDTGCGVTQDGLQSLFKEYVQVCKSLKKQN